MMKNSEWPRILLCLGMMLVTASSMAASPSENEKSGGLPLYKLEPTPDRTSLQRDGSDYLKRLLKDPANKQITLIDINTALINDKTQALTVTLPNGKSADFRLRDYDTLAEGMQGWVGYKASTWKASHAPSSPEEIDHDPLYYLSLVRAGDVLIGSAIVDGERYRIDNIGSGQHVLIKVDESKLPPEGEPLEPEPASGEVAHATSANHPQASHSIIRVLFIATNQRKAASPFYMLELGHALNNANQYMKNSQVNVTFELAGFYEGPYNETGRSYRQQLEDIRSAQPFAGAVLKERDRLRAHLVSMYSTASEFCGMAWINPGAAQAHSVITCASSLAHELGHNFGADHNWDAGDKVRNPPYQYGYRYTGTPRFRTQMSYDCSGGVCPRIAYWSNPRLTYHAMRLGTVEHHDVARRFNEQRGKIEGFYPPRPQVQLFNGKNFSGGQCTLVFSDANEIPPCNRVHSFKFKNFTSGMRLCFKATTLNWACYGGAYSGDFEVSDLDAYHPLPYGLVRETSAHAGALIGQVRSVGYSFDYYATIQLYSRADYRGDSCMLRLNLGTVRNISEWPGCDAVATGKSRSAKIHAFSGGNNKLCFLNSDHRRSLCFTGSYRGNFQIRNWDIGSGLPQGLVRTHAGGGHINGSVHRISFGYNSPGWPPAP